MLLTFTLVLILKERAHPQKSTIKEALFGVHHFVITFSLYNLCIVFCILYFAP